MTMGLESATLSHGEHRMRRDGGVAVGRRVAQLSTTFRRSVIALGLAAVRALLVLLVLAGGCRERASRATTPSAARRGAAPLRPAPLASVAAFPEPAAPPPPALSALAPIPEPAPHVPVKLIRAPRLSAPKGLATTPLFECTHVKFAWGHEFRGFVLDETGRVWLYDRGGWAWTPEKFSEPDSSARSNDSLWFGGTALAAKIAPALSTARIALASLREHSALIAQAQLGKLPPLDLVPVSDAGGGEYCLGYRWNEARTAYQGVDLRRNSSSAAQNLSSWLDEIEQALMQPPFNAISSELARIAEEANEEIIRKARRARSSRVVRAPTPKELIASPSPPKSPWHTAPGF